MAARKVKSKEPLDVLSWIIPAKLCAGSTAGCTNTSSAEQLAELLGAQLVATFLPPAGNKPTETPARYTHVAALKNTTGEKTTAA